MASSDRQVSIVTTQSTPIPLRTVLTVAGSDSSGGAGIEADVKTITAHGCYALTAITALTAQNTQKVRRVADTKKEILEDIFRSNFEDIRIDVIKTGLLTGDAIDVLSQYIAKYHQGKPVVIDPVMVASSGTRLSKEDVLAHGIEKLMDGVTLITPNMEEATNILTLFGEEPVIDGVDDLKKYATMIQQKTKALNVLLKGGHCPWTEGGKMYVTDVLFISATQATVVFKSDYVDTQNTHGTGCTLASAIASNLASGLTVEESVGHGIRYVQSAITSATKLGHGCGPLNHVYHITSPSVDSLKGDVFAEGEFVKYLTAHPTVAASYQEYITHPFVKQVAEGSLEKHRFVRFISQDYPYLMNYSRIHAILCSIAPDLETMDREIEILNDIKKELNIQAGILNAKGITDLESMEKSDACKEYIQYLSKIAEGREWLEITVAMAPCLLGYHYATTNFEITTDDADYKGWMETYRSEWYRNAVTIGEATLEKFSVGITAEKASKLVKIFGDVCVLESNFWNDALTYK